MRRSPTKADSKGTDELETNSCLCRVTRYDVIFLLAVLALSAFGLFHFGKGASAAVSRKAFVYENGKLIEKIDLKIDGIIDLSLQHGSMEVEIKQGRIRISNSSCPHKICVNTGWVEKPGGTIVCVPNKVLVEVLGKCDPTYHARTY